MMALVFSEVDRGKIVERSVWLGFGLLGRNIAPLHFKSDKRKPRPPNAHGDFHQLWADFKELARCFPVPGILK